MDTQKGKTKKEKKASKKETAVTPVKPTPSKAREASTQFKVVNAKLFLHLAPHYAGDEQKGVNDFLNKFLMRYMPEVDGVVLAYSHVRMVEDAARIIYDSPFSHFHITVRLTVFAPEVNTNLVGVVNKVSPDHIGLLVHNVFNASIPADAIRRGEFQWDDDVSGWRRAAGGGDEETVVGPGSVMRFTVTQLIKANDMLTIVGSLLADADHTGVFLNPTLEAPPWLPESDPMEDVEETEGNYQDDGALDDMSYSAPSTPSRQEPVVAATTPGSAAKRARDSEMEAGVDEEDGVAEEKPKKKKRKVKTETEGGEETAVATVKTEKKGKKAANTEEGAADGATTTPKKEKKNKAKAEEAAATENGAPTPKKTPKKQPDGADQPMPAKTEKKGKKTPVKGDAVVDGTPEKKEKKKKGKMKKDEE
ncbi:hypothetical protein HK104_007636 [Borealophlyctis nickersoniae]|nr:hypothetical protein HK104_007636 [Borealophlyctis nickersoniae]